jgi:hypothetical protein
LVSKQEALNANLNTAKAVIIAIIIATASTTTVLATACNVDRAEQEWSTFALVM